MQCHEVKQASSQTLVSHGPNPGVSQLTPCCSPTSLIPSHSCEWPHSSPPLPTKASLHGCAARPAAYSQILGPSLFPGRGTGIQVGKLGGQLLPLCQQPGPLFTKLPPPGSLCSRKGRQAEKAIQCSLSTTSRRENSGSSCSSQELSAKKQRIWEHRTPQTHLFIFPWLVHQWFWSITVMQMLHMPPSRQIPDHSVVQREFKAQTKA